MSIEVGEDPVVIPVTTTTVDENGNTVLTGYPSSGAYASPEPASTDTFLVVIGGGEGADGG